MGQSGRETGFPRSDEFPVREVVMDTLLFRVARLDIHQKFVLPTIRVFARREEFRTAISVKKDPELRRRGIP